MTPFLLLFVALATASPVKRQAIDVGLDANGDGLVSKDEVFAAMSLHEALVALDRDGDGFIYKPQIIELWGSENQFNILNTDNDTHLTFREIENGMSLSDFYDQFDHNKDGSLDVPEAYYLHYIYDVINNPFNPLDADGDGRLSNLEVQSHMTYDQVLTALDADGDQLLTSVELFVLLGSEMIEFLNHLDEDENGYLDFGEAHGHRMNLDRLFDRLDQNDSNYLEDGEGAGFYTVWDIILASGNTAPVTG